MPRVLSATPGWLSRPAPGFELFSSPPKSTLQTRETVSTSRPLRTIIQRGTQIFVAVGNEVRWADLILLKDFEKAIPSARSRQVTPGSGVDSIPESSFRTLKVSIPGKIVQLSLAPYGDYLAIVTTHTVHVVILPKQYEMDIGPVKVKSFQVGPSQHVLECKPVAAVLWHPLSPSGHCLVTLTTDAVVRLWELDQNNRASFSEPQLSIDLGKLANANDVDADLGASVFGTGKRFTPDIAYLEPAAACFGGLGRSGENPWSSMTLWITTNQGDIYTLCPLLPSKFHAFPGLIKNLWDSVGARRVEFEELGNVPDLELFQLRQQEDWLRGIDKYDTLLYTTPFGHQIDVLTRPSQPRPEPALQGPFDVGLADLDVCDLFVRNIQFGEEPLEFETGEILDEEDEESVPMGLSVVCLLTRDGTIHIVLELEGVEGRWIHPKDFDQQIPDRNLVILRSPSVSTQSARSPDAPLPLPPSITPDPRTAYSFFITHEHGVSYLSMDPWIERLRDELEEPSEAGSSVRADVFLETTKTNIEHLITFDRSHTSKSSTGIPSCATFTHPETGYMTIASFNGTPYSATLDTKHRDLNTSTFSQSHPTEQSLLLLPPPVREPYQPDNRFYDTTAFTKFLRSLPSQKPQLSNPQGIVNTEALNILITAHQVLSNQTHDLSSAASKTWRAIHRMLSEYQDQISKVRDQVSAVSSITGDDGELFDDLDVESLQTRLAKRLNAIKERQQGLEKMVKSVSTKLSKLSTAQVSEKQKHFEHEVNTISDDLAKNGPLLTRLEEVKTLKNEVVDESKELDTTGKENGTNANKHASISVPTRVRKQKMQVIDELLERESYMVEATVERLRKLVGATAIAV